MCTIHRYLWENKSSEQYIVQIEIQEQHYVQFIQFLVIILQSAKLDGSPMPEARKIIHGRITLQARRACEKKVK